MSSPIDRYWFLLDVLREQRRLSGWRPEMDRALLERIDDVFETLDDLVQEEARRGTWRGWPDAFDAQFERALVEDLDPEQGSAATRPPRKLAA